MYSKTAMPVELPREGGRLCILKNGYVYWITESHWDSNKKRTVDNRICVGKKVPDRDGWIYPNARYFTLFGSVPEDQSGSILSPIKRGRFNVQLNYGSYYALKSAAILCGCRKALDRAFGPQLADQIMAIDVYAIDAQSDVAQGFHDWCFDNYSGIVRAFNDSEISAFYGLLGSNFEARQNFLAFYREAYFELFPDADRNAMAFDSTNQNTNSKGLSLAGFGHAKVNEQLPVINTAVFVDEKTGIPVYYEHFCGGLLDKTQTPFTLEKAKDLGFQHLFLMMDRGYLCRSSLEALRKESFAVMCPDGLTFTANLIAKYRDVIKECEQYYIQSEDVYGIHISDTNFDGKNYDAYVYYDDNRAFEEKKSIHSRIKFFTDKIMKKKRFSENLQKLAAPWLVVEKIDEKDSEGRNFTVTVDTNSVQKYLDNAGFFVILSNTSLDATKIIEIARMRDKGEKIFRRLKYHLGLNKTYVHNLRNFEGKMFVAFVGLIIMEAFRYFVRAILDAKSSETTATVLAEMRKYKIMLKNSGEWMPQYAATGKQKAILTGLRSSAADIETAVRALRLRL